MKRAIALAFVAVLFATAAHSDGIGNQGIIGQRDGGGIGGSFAKPQPQPTGDILLVDNTSILLQTDNASFICIAGGC